MADGLVEISVDVDGLREVDRFFSLSADYLEDLHDPLEELMEALLDSVALQFDTEGAASGSPWHPLSDQYAKWKEAHFPGFPILVATGEMKRAMLDEGAAVQVGTDEAVYEPISDIAGYHQSGEVWLGNAWEHPGPYLHVLPRRAMVDLSESFKHEAVDRTFARFIARKLSEANTISGADVSVT